MPAKPAAAGPAALGGGGRESLWTAIHLGAIVIGMLLVIYSSYRAFS